MIENEHHVSKSEALEIIREITISVTEAYMDNYEYEIRYTEEQGKLSIWIIGLSIAIELLLLNRLENGDFKSLTIIILFSCITTIVAINAGIGLFTKLKKMRLISHYLDTLASYKYQKNDILLQLRIGDDLKERLLKDAESGTLHDNILNLKYTKRQTEIAGEQVVRDRNYLVKSHHLPSSLLIIQVLLAISLYIFMTYQ